MQRLIIVYNPNSAHHQVVERDVLRPARELNGFVVGKYEIRKVPVEQNVAALAKILQDGDIVVSAGGDGTATVTLNGVMKSECDVRLAVLPYGNFNDLARTLKCGDLERVVMTQKTRDFWPLEVLVDDKHWRYAACYVTVGMFAESTAVFNEGGVRQKLKRGNKGAAYSVRQLANWYFDKRGEMQFLPQEFELNGRMVSGATDYLAVNGATMAKMMRGGDWWTKRREFWSVTTRLGRLVPLCWFMGRSIMFGVPGGKTTGDVLKFANPSDVMIQAEGEYQKLSGVREIVVRKAERSVKVIYG